MKKNSIVLFIPLVLMACYADRLQPIRALAKSENIDEKTEASLLYQDAIKTLVDAYASSAGLNKDIGTRLMNMGSYEKALEHFEAARNIRNNDKTIYHNMAICYVNLYKINNNVDNLAKAKENYKIALNIAPDSKGILYDYAQLLVFGYENYTEAIQVLNHYIYDLGTEDKDGYFLLGRAYYALGDFDKAYSVFTSIYKFENQLSQEEKDKLVEFINQSSNGAVSK